MEGEQLVVHESFIGQTNRY